MADQSKSDPLDVELLGKTLRQWNGSWERIPGGFKPKHPELASFVGLARAILNGRTMYILRGVEHSDRGIEKGLQRIRGQEQTGNAGYGAQMIRKHIDEVELEVLLVGKGVRAVEPTKQLKKAMVKYYDPPWLWPFLKRMKEMQAARKK